ncbi:hypothetical protein [Streptomyces sp. NPDC056323]|uniref:hypothetical protein n=1 Tax=Streptomyces sp. NPDC056323 TaxID=3345784 RepID=UPI0035DFDD47
MPSTGWDLHEYENSGLTHLNKGRCQPANGDVAAQKPENVRRYFPSAEVIAEVASLLALGDSRR